MTHKHMTASSVIRKVQLVSHVRPLQTQQNDNIKMIDNARRSQERGTTGTLIRCR